MYEVTMGSTVHHFVFAYIGAILLTVVLNGREFSRQPDKARRYKALPLIYKATCWLGVLPLLAATTVHGAFGLVGFSLFFLLEAACIRWYRNAGLY
jgi:hypothetical protein